jgi:acrylyl-CoA reductase (NADPH)
MQSVIGLERHGLKPGRPGEVLVTGAAGGVGSVAIAILAKLGYTVAASTGRPEQADYLKSLGASVIVDRGLAGGKDLPGTVLPFILRGVNLLGIESVACPMTLRQEIWNRLAADLPREKLDAATSVIPLGDVLAAGGEILKGRVRGRIVVDVNA